MIAVVSWASGPVGSKALLLAERHGLRLRPLQVAFWAIAVGWVALLAVLAARGRLRWVRSLSLRGWLVVALMGFFGFAAYPVSINIAFTRLLLPDVLVVTNLSPVMVVIFQASAFGAVVRLLSGWEQPADTSARPSPIRIAAGLALCLLGVAIIATEGHLVALGRVPSAAGALAALFAAVAWGIYSNLGRFVAVRPGARTEGIADLQTLLGMTFGLLAMAIWLTVTNELVLPSGYDALLHFGSLGSASVGAWPLIVSVGLINYCLGYTLWTAALEVGHAAGGAHRLPALTYLTLVLAVALGWVLLRERFGPGFWQGTALIAAGNAVNLWRGRRATASTIS